MTHLRFVGGLPVWLGLLLATIVAGLAWRYYHRECGDLSRRLRWTLPCLRSLAFFLGVLVLTGPILEHRTVIGELGRVKVFVDASQSMNLLDRHLTTGRKLLVAEQQGWLEADQVDAQLMDLAEAAAAARRRLEALLQETEIEKTALDAACDDLVSALEAASGSTNTSEVIAALRAVDTTTPAEAAAPLAEACQRARAIEADILQAFEQQITELVDSGDPSIQAAISMFDETPRWRRAERSLLTTPAPLFASLRERHDVEVFALHDDGAVRLLHGSAPGATAETLSDSADSSTTNLATGITETQTVSTRTEPAPNSEAGSRANTAVVLITDGRHNAGPSPLQTARVLGGQGVAFFPVAVGATHRAPDLAVRGLEHPQMVFRKDDVRGTMIVHDHMPAGQSMVARIAHGETVLWEKQLTTTGTGERRVDFEFGIEETVEQLSSQFSSETRRHAVPVALSASVTPLADEAETENNHLPMRFAAITQNQKMLIIDGRSRWETRYLRNLFDRDRQWDVTVLIAGPGNDLSSLPRGDGDDQFPETRDGLFEYDLIIFGEVASELFADHELTWIREFVETRGGGLIFIDGRRERLRKLTQDDLAPLLPVEWNDAPFGVKSAALQLTDRGAREPSLTLETEQDANSRFWSTLPPPHTLSNVRGVPGAEVLLEAIVNNEPAPVMVTKLSGAGRVLYMAWDETWRWRYKAADTYHQRIWNQLAKFVMPRPFAVSDEYVAIDSGAVSYASGDSADVRVQLTGLDGKPAAGATVDALFWKDGRVAFTTGLSPDADVPGLYRGTSGDLQVGEYEVSVRASGFSEQALQARTQFVVRPPETTELTETSCNEPLLQQLADASGGQYLREEQLNRLPDLLEPLSNGRVSETTTELWQSYWWFAAIVILLAVEWFLRKRAGLL